jgi:hypothetical protein
LVANLVKGGFRRLAAGSARSDVRPELLRVIRCLPVTVKAARSGAAVGYKETGRALEAGYEHVFMRKRLAG